MSMKEKVKTAIQITQFQGDKYSGSQSFRVSGQKAKDIQKILTPITKLYPIVTKPSGSVRVQLFEFQEGTYRKRQGVTLTLHAAYLYDVAKWVKKILTRNKLL
jgi:hypothetical protein